MGGVSMTTGFLGLPKGSPADVTLVRSGQGARAQWPEALEDVLDGLGLIVQDLVHWLARRPR